jgi:hypothetical protein
LQAPRWTISRALISAFEQWRNQRVSSYSDTSRSVLSKPKSQHTTCPQFKRLCVLYGCLHGTGRAGGNCSFPFLHLNRRGAVVSHVFVATFTKYERFVCRLRRGETAAVPKDLSSKKNVHRERLPNCSSRMPYFLWLAQRVTGSCSSVSTSGPGHRTTRSASRSHQGGPAQERRRFRTASAVPVASNCTLTTVASIKLSLTYAPTAPAMRTAGRRAS